MISENEASEVYIFDKKYKNEKTSFSSSSPKSLESLKINKKLFDKRELSYIKSTTAIYTINENIYNHDSIKVVLEKLLKNTFLYNNIPIESITMYSLNKLKDLSTSNINFCCDNLKYISVGKIIDDEEYYSFFNNPFKNRNNNKFSVFSDLYKKISIYDIFNNTLYFTTCDNITEFSNYIINYFPLLNEQNIKNRDDYLTQKSRLLENNSKYFNDTSQNSWKIIDYFDNFSNKNEISDKIKINNKIKSLSFIKNQHSNIFLPIEILFRKLQTNSNVPLLKLNIGNKSINQYRLYGKKRNTNLNIIPNINLNILNKLYNNLYDLKERSLACLILLEHKNKPVYIVINLLENGNYFLHFQPLKLLEVYNNKYSIDTIELLCKKAIDIFFNSVHRVVLDLPIELFKINNLYDESIIIKQVQCNYNHSFKDLKAVEFNLNNILRLVEFIFKLKSSNKNINRISLDYIYSTSHVFGYPDIVIERQNLKTKTYNINVNNLQSISDIETCTSFLECFLYILESPELFYKNFSNFSEINWKKMYIPKDLYADRLKKEFNRNDDDDNNDESTVESKVITMKDILSKMQVSKNIGEEEKPKETSEESVKETSEESVKETSEESVKETSEESPKESAEKTLPVADEGDDADEEEINNNEESPEDKLLLNLDDDSDVSKNTDSSDFLGGASKETLRDYIQSRIRSKDPELVEKSEKIYTSPYSRTCPTVNKRQPIILTDEEKENIDKNHPGSYGKSLTYNTKGQKSLHYICPKYWCVDENISLNESDIVRDGTKITSEYCKTSKGEDGSILEFNDKKNHYDKNGNYIFGTPAVGNKSCIPCCFKKSTTVNKINPKCISDDDVVLNDIEERKISDEEKIESKSNSKEKVESNEKEKMESTEKEKVESTEKEKMESTEKEKVESTEKEKVESTEKKTQSQEIELNTKNNIKLSKDDKKLYNYIQQANKFPLEIDKWGHIPIQIQNLLGTQNINCDNGSCLLRYGVEKNKNQSFLCAIASIYNLNIFKKLTKDNFGKTIHNSKYEKHMPLAIFKKYLINSITLDIFSNLNNGNLIDIFSSNKNVDIENNIYKESIIYKKLKDKKNNKTLQLIINSYENFKKYLKSEDYIDYTYLWDLICTPNENLFKNGINIIILEILGTDELQNVNIICPTNYYSQSKFNSNFDTCIIIKYGEYYEPLYTLHDNSKFTIMIPYFEKDNVDLLPFYNQIKDLYENKEKCLPFSILENDVTYKNYDLKFLIKICEKYKLNILSQIVDIFGKVNGIIIQIEENNTQFLPCFPSSININYDIIFYNDFIFNDYSNTIKNINKINNDTSNEVKCSFGKKVIEIINKKRYIVGLLTEIDLFIPIKEIIEDNEMDDVPFEMNKYVYVDKKLKINLSENNESINIDYSNIKTNIELETLFYNRFKILLREKLNKNKLLQSKIFELIKDPQISYNNKQKKIYNELTIIVDDIIFFTDETDILNCIQKSININNEKKDCFKKGNKQLLPKLNLVSKKKNKIFYIIKVIDEMIRAQYGLYFFEVSNKYFSFINNYDFDTNENEIIVTQNELLDLYKNNKLLNKNYFKNKTSFQFSNPELEEKFKRKINFKNNKTLKNVNYKAASFEIKNEKRKKRVRCPKGTRRNRKTGICETIK